MATVLSGLADEVELGVGAGALGGPWAASATPLCGGAAEDDEQDAGELGGRPPLLDNPKAAFRFISGLVIALFVGSAAIGALSSIAAASSSGGDSAGKDTLAAPFSSFSTSNCPASARTTRPVDKPLTNDQEGRFPIKETGL